MSDGQTLPAVRYRLTAYRWPTAPSRLPLVILSDSLCHPAKAGALWVLGNGVNLSLWQQWRENHTTGLRPEENKPTALSGA